MTVPEDHAGLYFALAIVGSIVIPAVGMLFSEWLGKVNRERKDRKRIEKRKSLNPTLDGKLISNQISSGQGRLT